MFPGVTLFNITVYWEKHDISTEVSHIFPSFSWQNNIRDKLNPIAIDLDYELNEDNIVRDLADMQLMPILDANVPKQVAKQVR